MRVDICVLLICESLILLNLQCCSRKNEWKLDSMLDSLMNWTHAVVQDKQLNLASNRNSLLYGEKFLVVQCLYVEKVQ